MNPNAPSDAANLAAEIALSHQKIHRAVVRKIQEMYDGGLSDFEIQAITGVALPLVRLILRGALPPGDSHR